jgi:hypothetical protein
MVNLEWFAVHRSKFTIHHSKLMLKQINIGQENRPIHFGYAAKRRLDAIIQKIAINLCDDHPTMGMNIVQNTAAMGAILTNSTEFQIQLLKVGLEEGHKIATGQKTVTDISEDTICAWLDADPRSIDEALVLYAEQSTIIAAKKAGEDPEKFKAKMIGNEEASTPENPSGTPSNESPSAGSE